MSRAEREYNSYARPKASRNKWGLIESSILENNNSVFSTGTAGGAAGDQMYVPEDVINDLDDFTGATATEDGQRGIVPQPKAGDNLKFLQGSGGWVDIPAYRWFTEWPESEGLEKRGLQLNGDLNVTDTITCKNLEAESAHFWTLIIDEVKANGGQLLVSPSMFHIDHVGGTVQYSIFDADGPLFQLITNRADVYNILRANDVEYIRCRRLYQRNDDGERAIENECQIGDMMRCRSFNIKAGTYRNVSNTDYWSFVVNTGEEPFTDEDGNTYDAFYIDLAFTLRKSDGHNYPLGTILYLDGRAPKYPDGYEEILDTLELKRTNQDILDGTRDVDPEYFENSEWTDIQEYIIKIRGLDDEVENITGRYANNKLYDNEKYVSDAKESLDTALYGATRSAQNTRSLSSPKLAQMILTGTIDDDNSSLDSGVEDYSNDSLVRAITGPREANSSVSVARRATSRIALPKDTVTEKEFIVAEDVYEDGYVGNPSRIIYTKGDVIEPGTELVHDLPVIDVLPEQEITIIDKELNIERPATEEEEKQMDNPPENTPSGITTEPEPEVDYNILTEWQFGYTSYYPQFRIRKNDSLACLGHLYDPTRQNAIVLSSTNPIDPELLAPAMAQYAGIDRFGTSISKYRLTAIAANGNEFIGSFFVNYKNTYMEINDRIQMFITDVTTGLESVGIHLDGQNSTISMIGTIDLKQHSQDSYDTLNLYDNLGVKRLEITPFPIPEKNSSESFIHQDKIYGTAITDKKTIQQSYITFKTYKPGVSGIDIFNLFNAWIYQYILENYKLTLTTTIDLGRMSQGWILDLRELNLNLKMTPYFNGSTVVTDFGISKQSITGIRYTFKRDGVSIPSKTDIPLTGYNIPGGMNTGDIKVYQNIVFNDYKIPNSGNYTLEVTMDFKPYLYYECKTKYNNYYFILNTSFSGNVSTMTTRVTKSQDDTDAYKMTIGTNGMVFSNNNSKYFYAAKDGIEMRWGDDTFDAGITLDDDHGLKITKGILPVSSATELGIKHDIIECKAPSGLSGYTITLPDPQQYGQGRTITILGFTGLTVQTKSGAGKIIIYAPILGYLEATSFTFGQDGKEPFVSVQLMAVGTNWAGLSCM